jgi:hypothetical protein
VRAFPGYSWKIPQRRRLSGVFWAPVRARVLIIAAALSLPAAAPAALAATPTTVAVTPKTGGPRTTFWLTLRNPFTTGPSVTLQRSETVNVSGPRRRGCVWSGSMPVRAAPALQPVRIALSPSRVSRAGGPTAWCSGTFRGSVILTERFQCAPPLLCPMLAIRPQTIARFTFRVTRRS